MKSKIAIEGMAFYAYHGFYEEEQKIGGMDIPTKLIETLCRRIFDKVKEKSETTISKPVFVSIKVTKNNPPVNGLNHVFVQLEG